jgi:hypothetical protein
MTPQSRTAGFCDAGKRESYQTSSGSCSPVTYPWPTRCDELSTGLLHVGYCRAMESFILPQIDRVWRMALAHIAQLLRGMPPLAKALHGCRDIASNQRSGSTIPQEPGNSTTFQGSHSCGSYLRHEWPRSTSGRFPRRASVAILSVR